MRVGTSAYGHQEANNVRDHPHACGDKYDSFVLIA